MSPVDLRELVREIPDLPMAGILAKDTAPLLLDRARLDPYPVRAVLEYSS